jgi:hypothetical protein
MHEYLRDTLIYRYTECESCTNRTEFTCIKCGFCWSCHWKKEQAEKIESYNTEFVNSSSVPPFLNKYSQSSVEEKRELMHPLIYHPRTTVIDVFGEESEPICNYLRCHHKFSVHGLGKRICQCKHAQNIIIGVSKKTDLISRKVK